MLALQSTQQCVYLFSTSSMYLPIVLIHACYDLDTDMNAAKASNTPRPFSKSIKHTPPAQQQHTV